MMDHMTGAVSNPPSSAGGLMTAGTTGNHFTSSLTQLTNMTSHHNPGVAAAAGMMEPQHGGGNSYPSSMYSHSTAASMLPQMTMSHPVMHSLQEVRKIIRYHNIMMSIYI